MTKKEKEKGENCVDGEVSCSGKIYTHCEQSL